jgi:hypothetical protein
MNAYAKTEFEQMAVILRAKRADTKVYKFPYPTYRLREVQVPVGKGKKVKMKLPFDTFEVTQGKINFQIYTQNAIVFVRSVSIMMNLWWVWFSVPMVKYATYLWAKKKHPDMFVKLKMEESMENFIFHPRPDKLVRNLYRQTVGKAIELRKNSQMRNEFVEAVNTWDETKNREFVKGYYGDWEVKKFKPKKIIVKYPETPSLSLCQSIFAGA